MSEQTMQSQIKLLPKEYHLYQIYHTFRTNPFPIRSMGKEEVVVGSSSCSRSIGAGNISAAISK